MTAASALESLPLFLGWCLIGGMAYSLAFTGGLGLINRLAPEHHRGAILSLLYLVAYTLQAVTAISVGAIATATDLGAAVGAAAAAIAAICAVLITLVGMQAITARREPAAARRRA